MEIAKFVLIGLDVLIALIFLLYIICGWTKGFLKSTINFGVKIFYFIIALIASSILSKIIIDIASIDGELLIDIINQEAANLLFDGDVKQLVELGLDELIRSFAIAIINLVLSLVLSYILILIFGSITKLILKISLKNRFERKPGFKSRVFGFLVSLVAFVAMFYILFLPIYGGLEVGAKTLSYLSDTSEDIKDINRDVKTIVDDSLVYRVTSNTFVSKNKVFGIGAKTFGSRSSFRYKNEKINLVNDIDSILPNIEEIAELVEEISETESINEKVALIKDSDVKIVIKCFENNNFIKLAYPIAIDILESKSSNIEVLSKLNLDYKALKKVDILNDIKQSEDFLLHALNVLKQIDLDNADVSILKDDPNLVNLISTTIEKALATKLFEECFPKVVQYLLKENTGLKDYQFIIDLITVEYIKYSLTEDLSKISSILADSKELQLFEQISGSDSIPNLDLSDPIKYEKADAIITNLLDLKLIVNNETLLLSKIIEISDLKGMIPELNLGAEVDWSVEKAYLKAIIIDILDIGPQVNIITSDYNTLIENKSVIMKLAKLLDDLYKFTITKDNVFPMIEEILKSGGYEIILLDEEKQLIIENTFVKEVSELFDLLSEVELIFGENPLGSEIDIKTVDGASVASLMKKAGNSVIASKIIGDVLNKVLGVDGLNINPIDPNTMQPKYDFTNKDTLINSADSIGNMINLVNSMNEFTEDNINVEEITIDKIADSLEVLGSSNMDKELVNDMVNELCKENDLKVPENVDWQKEAVTVEQALDIYQSASDKENFDINDYPQIIEELENTEVAEDILKYLGIIK